MPSFVIPIYIKRNTLANIGSLAEGQEYLATDVGQVFIGSAFGNLLVGVKINNTATVDPTATDDESLGYSVGSTWVNTTDDKAFTCLDASTGAAVWQLDGSIAVGGTVHDGTDTRVLFVDGTAVGEDDAFTWDKTTDTLTIGNAVLTGNGERSVLLEVADGAADEKRWRFVAGTDGSMELRAEDDDGGDHRVALRASRDSNVWTRIEVIGEQPSVVFFGLRSPQPITADEPNFLVSQSRGLTSDATPTNLHFFELEDDNAYLIESRVIARRVGGTSGSAGDCAAYIRRVKAKRTGGGGAVIGTIQDGLTSEDQSGWDCTFVTSGNEVRLQVTGAADNEILWHCTNFIQNLSEE